MMQLTRIPVRQIVRLISLSVALCFCAPSFGKSFWMIIGQVGSKPERIAYYAHASHTIERQDTEATIAEIMRGGGDPKTLDARLKNLRKVDVTVVQVFENPKAPAIMRMYMVFDCHKRLFRISQAEALARNGVPHKSARPEWQKVPNNWIDRALFVACEDDVWRPAAADDLNNGKGAQPKLAAHGVALVGTWAGYDQEMQANDFTWETLWPDGARPPFNNNRSAEEEKVYQEQIARNAQIREADKQGAEKLDSLIGALEGYIGGMDKETKFRTEIADNFKKHQGKGGDDEFWGLQGLTERELVDMWGAPTSASSHGDLRMLRFTNQDDQRQSVAVVDQKTGATVATQTVGELRVCDVTFKLRVGGNRSEPRVADYTVSGQNCRLSTLRQRF